MWCAISGTTPTNAVVTPGGVVYDKALIVKAIEVGVCEGGWVCAARRRARGFHGWIARATASVCARARSRALCVRVGLNGLRSEGG